MPTSYIRLKKFIRLFVFLILCINYQAVTALNSKATFFKQSNKQDEPWYVHPLSIQGTSHIGTVLRVPLLDVALNKNSSKFLMTVGERIDVGLLYPKKWIWKWFDCYPRLGLMIKYNYITANNIEEKGHIVGSVLYLEPNYNHLDGWEILPRFGVGIAYIKMPGAFSSVKPTKADDDEDYSDLLANVDPFREGASLNLTFDLLVKYRLTPRWHLYLSLGADYLPELSFSKTSEENTVTDPAKNNKTIELYTASLGCSYTFNPSIYNPDRILDPKKATRIDISFLNSFRKPEFSNNEKTPNNNQGPNTQSNDTDTKYHYIGGLHAQWSMRIFNNQAIVLGTEWIKDYALKKEIEKSIKKSNLQASFLIGHEFLWGKLIFGQYIGIYALNNRLPLFPNDPAKNFSNKAYLRLGLNYKITDYLHVGTSLKIGIYPHSRVSKPVVTDITRIEYLDFRIGYNF